MRGVINRYQALIYSILLFFMLNLFKDKMPSGTNQVLGGIVIIMIIACMYPLKLNEVRILTFYLICAGAALFYCEDIINHVKYTIYFFLVLMVYFMCIRKEYSEKLYKVFSDNWRLINLVIILNTLILVWMLINRNCYSTDLWNGAGYFQGFSVPHGAAGSSCLAISICILLSNCKKKYKYLYGFIILINMLAIFKTGARTYLAAVVALAGTYVFCIFRSKSKRIGAIVLGGIAFAGALFTSESFINKMKYSMDQLSIDGFSLLDALTSSRSLIWSNDIRLFFQKSNLIKLLFGGGFDYSYELNASWTYRIQAHNGFLEVLLSTGILGFVLYLCILFKVLKHASNDVFLYKMVLIVYLPVVLFFDDILQAPSYVMSVLFVTITISMIDKSGILRWGKE